MRKESDGRKKRNGKERGLTPEFRKRDSTGDGHDGGSDEILR